MTFQQAQTHGRGRVLTRTECCFSRDDDRAGGLVSLFFPWPGFNHQPRSDPERFRLPFLREILQPMSRQFLRAAPQLPNQGAGLADCWTCDLEQTPPVSGPVYDREGPAKPLIQLLAPEPKPVGRDVFSPEIHDVSKSQSGGLNRLLFRRFKRRSCLHRIWITRIASFRPRSHLRRASSCSSMGRGEMRMT